MKALLCILTVAFLLVGLVSSPAQTPPVITQQPADFTACAGGDAVFSVSVTGDPPMNFIWFTNSVPVFSGVVSTPTNSTLTLPNVQFADDLMQIYVQISSPHGFTQSVTAVLHVPDPCFSVEPEDISAPTGGTLQFHAVANGTSPLDYRWWFQQFPSPIARELTNNAQVFGADTPTLIVFNVGATNAGKYWVTVTNGFSATATSRQARGSVGPPPMVNGPGSRIVRVFNNTTLAPTYGGPLPRTFQWYRNDVPIGGAINSILPVVNVQRPDVGLYHVVVSNPGGSIASQKAHLQVRLTLEGTPVVFLEEATDEMQSLTNAVPSFVPPPTSVFHGVPLLFSTYNATASPDEASRCGVPPSHSMWVLYTSPRNESTRVSTEGSDFDTVAAVYTWDGNPSHAPIQIACDNNSGYDGSDSMLFFPAAALQNYYIAVDCVGGATGTARLQVGESIRKYKFENGSFRFEWAGSFWANNSLLSATNLAPPINWTTLLTMPATNRDWIVGYTNKNALSETARFYSTSTSTNP